MSLSYSPTAIKGVVVEQVFTELLFENKTIADSLVSFHEGVKYDTLFTEESMTATQQAYVATAPSASGTLTLADTAIIPIKVMYYDELNPETLRSSRFKRDMASGAYNIMSGEFNQLLMSVIAPKVSYDLESKFWNNITSATQTAIAALTPGTGQTSVGASEQAYAAALTAGLFDGVVTRMIYNGGALGTRVKYLGTTITASNIGAEYAKIYAAIPAKTLNQANEKPLLYAPYSHKQYMIAANIAATYRDVFMVDIASDTFAYNGVKVVFVPLPENCVIAALPSNIHWICDMKSDINALTIDKIAANREDIFYKMVMTEFAHVTRQNANVLYLYSA